MPLPPAPPLPLTPAEQAETDNLPGVPQTVLVGSALNYLEGNNSVVQTVSTELLVDFTTTATVPAYVTLLTLPITTVLAASFLNVRFTGTVRQIGLPGVNVAPNFRVLVDAALQVGGTTLNQLPNLIQPVAIEKGKIAVVAGLHTVIIQIAKFGGPFQTLVIDVASLPDLNNATLTVQEVR